MTVGQSSGSPAIDNQARYVTEGDTVVAKPMKKEKGGKTSAVPVRLQTRLMCVMLTRALLFLREW